MLTISFCPSIPGTYARLRRLLCWLFIIISGGGSGVYMNVCVFEWVGVLGSCNLASETNHTMNGSPLQHSLNRPQISLSEWWESDLQEDTSAT